MSNFIFLLESNSSTESISLLSSSGCCNIVWGFPECGPDISPAFMIIHWINISFSTYPPQPESLLHHHVDLFLIFPSEINSQTLCWLHFCCTPVKMKLGVPPGQAGLLLPDSSSFPSCTRSTENLSESFSSLHFSRTKTVHTKCLGSWNSHKYQWGHHIIFPMETFPNFNELLLRTELRFKSHHVSFTWPKFTVMNLNSRDLHEACSL